MQTVVIDIYGNSPGKDLGKHLGTLSIWNFATDDGTIPTSTGVFKWYPEGISLSNEYAYWGLSRSGTWVLTNDWTLRLYVDGLLMTQWSCSLELNNFFKDFYAKGLVPPESSGGRLYDCKMKSVGGFLYANPALRLGEMVGGNWTSLSWKFNRFSK